MITRTKAEVLLVNNCPPYHPEFLKELPVYRVLYSSDDPDSTYKRNIPYLHAYQHVFFAAPAYSAQLDMKSKMTYCGMPNADWLPIGVFDFEHESGKGEKEVFGGAREIDVIYIGGFYRQKLELLARVKKAMGRKLRLHGVFKLKHNLYFNVRFGFPGWIAPVSNQERVRLYQQSKIGFNVHWNEFGLGNQRLYHLPANGVMQICDCVDSLGRVFELGREVQGYRTQTELISLIEKYLSDEPMRRSIALEGYRRTMQEYRLRTLLKRAHKLIEEGMRKLQWRVAN
jgi:spore maturation protein CgeB